MVFGLSITTFTLLHVIVSLLAIVAGLVVVGGLAAGARLDGWTGLFLATTFLTNASGFFFPTAGFLPSHGVGVVSLLLLPAVLWARYRAALTSGWRRGYGVLTTTLLWLNVFVLISQLFRRLPALIVLAPKQQEPPFLLTQVLVLAVFVWLGRAALRGFSSPAMRLDPVVVAQGVKAEGRKGVKA
jgi:hypothetical protein